MHPLALYVALFFFITTISTHSAAQLGTQKRSPYRNEISPSLVIIIDDLGNHLARGQRAIELPGALTYAILPHTPQSKKLSSYIDEIGGNKEIIIHMPMEAISHKQLGPGGLAMHQDQQDFVKTLRAAMHDIPLAKGLSNHMGSQLTTQPDRMSWLMSELSKTHFYFIDSKTTDNSAAIYAAVSQRIPYLARDIFLDHNPIPAAIDKAYKKALALASRSGLAVLIAHPYPATLEYLERELPKLDSTGISLINASQAIEKQTLRYQYIVEQRYKAPPTS